METNLISQIIVLAIFLSLNNFLVSVGMGFSSVWGAKRLKVASVFGVLDFGMPLLGIVIGRWTGNILGNVAFYLGIFLLIVIGIYLIIQGVKGGRKLVSSSRIPDAVLGSLPAILFIGFWLSVDNLFVGFSLGMLGASLILAVVIFGLVTFLMSLLGISIGKKLRQETEKKIAQLAGKGRLVTGIVFILVALWKLFEAIL